MNEFNAGDEDQVKERKHRAKHGRERELEDIKTVLSTREGRRFYWRYLGECGVFRTSFTGSSETFFREGKRDIGLRLMADMNDAAPEAFILMQQEAKKELNG